MGRFMMIILDISNEQVNYQAAQGSKKNRQIANK
jgi:hypothetical protein